MGFRGEEKALPVRSKGELARAHFAQAAMRAQYLLQEGTVTKKDYVSFKTLINPQEYSAGITHIISTSAFGAEPLGENDEGVLPSQCPPSNRTSRGSLDYSNFFDISHNGNMRGYLQPMTLSEYCTFKGWAQAAARTLQICWYGGTGYVESNGILLDTSTKKPFNEFAAYADKIVPVITWYYDDSNGDRVSGLQKYTFAKWFTANRVQTKKYERQQIPLGGGHADTYVTNDQSTPITYYSIAPPYVSTVTDTYMEHMALGANLNGAVYCTWNGDDRSIYVEYDSAPYYTMLRVGFTGAARGTIYPVTSGTEYINAGVAERGTFSYINAKADIPVFNSVEDIIALFADYGVIVTTDWDEVLNPTPTPEESATPNPDPTDREIPNFPDNTTDYTPVEPAYITPSTFGQSCVYNPTTTRDFLRWVCDNTVDISNWARLFANPADVITGINLYNLDIVAHDTAHVEAKTETNILGVTTPIPNYTLLGGYNNIVDGGTLHLQAYYGNYADFTSMTYQMFIPFVGFTTLRACDVVNKTLHLYYAVDFATGSAVAFVNSDDKLIYASPCTVAGKIPLSTSDRNSQMINNTLSVLGGLSGLLGGVASGNVGGGVGALMGGLGGLQMQTNYSNKGSLSSVNIYKLIPAFVERTRYDLFFPSNDSAYINAKYQTAAGAPSTQFDTLLNCVDAGGFVQSDVVYLTSQTATETEKQQIIDLIKSGIYL